MSEQLPPPQTKKGHIPVGSRLGHPIHVPVSPDLDFGGGPLQDGALRCGSNDELCGGGNRGIRRGSSDSLPSDGRFVGDRRTRRSRHAIIRPVAHIVVEAVCLLLNRRLRR